MKHITLILLLILSQTLYAQSPIYIFESGFEGSTQLYQYQFNGAANPNYADIEGVDNGYDWVLDLDGDTTLGTFRIFYQTGDTSICKAEIVTDPLNSNNNVLKFGISDPNVTYTGGNGDTLQKGRIQGAINGNVELNEFYIEEKLYLHPDLATLKTSPLEIDWFTLQEVWNNEALQAFPFRITLDLQKPAGVGSDFYFGVHGQTRISQGQWNTRWQALDTGYVVPVGKWLTLKTYFLQGDSLHGIFRITLTDDLGNSHDIVNITHWTQHPDDPNPDGVTSFHAMKLYTYGELIRQMDSLNKEVAVYWDDFKIWTDTSLSNGISEVENTSFKHYPNPTQGLLRLKPEIKFVEFSIMKPNGQVIETIESPGHEIDLSQFPAGLYLIRLSPEIGLPRTIKVIKN